jgi:hypothetical protein
MPTHRYQRYQLQVNFLFNFRSPMRFTLYSRKDSRTRVTFFVLNADACLSAACSAPDSGQSAFFQTASALEYHPCLLVLRILCSSYLLFSTAEWCVHDGKMLSICWNTRFT